MRKILFLYFLFLLIQAYSIQSNPILYKKDKIICICIPKTGTHLLLKCLSLFQVPNITFDYEKPKNTNLEHLAHIRAKNKFPPPYHYKGQFHVPTSGPLPRNIVSSILKLRSKRLFFTHFPYTSQFELFLKTHTYANFLMIRDPRDMVVSFAFMVQKSHEGKTTLFEPLLLDLITGQRKHFIQWGVEIHTAYPLLWELGICNFYKLYLPWAKAQNFCVVKFEDLVGENGGSTKEKQVNEIQRIAHHIGYRITNTQIEQVIKDLYGNSWTFREGQIGSWKKYFTPKIKKAFKQLPGMNELLINLGYEKNTNW